jgi:hypothetical protein
MRTLKMSLIGMVAAGAMTACMFTGVVPVGPDTYMMSMQGPALASGASVKATLDRDADAWCRKQGLVMVPVSERTTDGVPPSQQASAEITFKAVSRDDADTLSRPTQAAPNTVRNQ